MRWWRRRTEMLQWSQPGMTCTARSAMRPIVVASDGSSIRSMLTRAKNAAASVASTIRPVPVEGAETRSVGPTALILPESAPNSVPRSRRGMG